MDRNGRIKWEYQSIGINPKDEVSFNALGGEGWELVALLPPDNRLSHTGIFKRPKIDADETDQT